VDNRQACCFRNDGRRHDREKTHRGERAYLRFAHTRRRNKELGLEEDHSRLSGLLFGIVPVRQVLRANPWQIFKAGSTDVVGRRLNLRALLLVLQIAVCVVLVTSSLVAVSNSARRLAGDLFRTNSGRELPSPATGFFN
jgi:hypothetical protein